MVDAGGLLVNAATIMFVVHVMGTTAGLPAHFSPTGMLGPVPPPLHCLPELSVNSVHSIVPVEPDQEPGCLCSQVTVGLRLGGSPSGSVPVRLFLR